MAQTRAAVVAGKEEALVTEIGHHLDHILGHDAEAVVDEIGAGLGQRAVAVAAQICEHHVITRSQPRSDGVPQHMIVRVAMQQQQRRARAAVAHADDGALGAHIEMFEPWEQVRHFRAAPAGRIAGIIGGGRFGYDRGLLRQCGRGDCRSRARGQGLNQSAAAHAFVGMSGLKMRHHSGLAKQRCATAMRD